MDKQFIRHVKGIMAARFGLNPKQRENSGGTVYAAGLPEEGVYVSFSPLRGRDELILGLAWPPSESTLGYADLRRFSPMGQREPGFWIDVRWLETVDGKFPSDARLDTNAFLPRPVDFVDMKAVLAGAKLPLEQLAKRFDYSVEKTQRLMEGYYLEHPDEITPALRRNLPDWSTLGRVAALPMAVVTQACCHWEDLLKCVLTEGVAEFVGLLNKLPRESLPAEPPKLG
jgi:hypothetical protein